MQKRKAGRLEDWESSSLPPFQPSIVFAFILFFISFSGNAQTVTITAPGAGTFTVPCNVSSIKIECWGAGGGSGGGTNTGLPGGSGGGGGAYASSTITVTPGQTLPYVVGLGGPPSGGSGGPTSFNGGVVLAMAGSSGADDGGLAGVGGSGPASTGTIKFGGGNGFQQVAGTDGGGGGGAGGSTAPGGFATGIAGGIGGAVGGGNGGMGQPSGANGQIGFPPGGGAGGSGKRVGGPESGMGGANGQIRITYTQFALSGTYSIGPTGNYTSITASIAALQCVPITGPVIFELQSTYTGASETYPLIFPSIAGASATNTITYRPAAGATSLVTGGAPASGITLINFNGGNYITFDGRPGGTGTSREWTIRNTRTAATVGNTFTFLNDASNNTLTYLNIEGEASSANAIILFSTTTGAAGNDNNTISFCNIRDLTAGGTAVMPCTGIYSSGTATPKTNSGNIIDNNQFVDIFNPAGAISSGVEIASNNDSWSITNNHFYQGTGSYIDLITNPWSGIFINGGGGYVVTGNFVGGKGPNCSGGAFTITSGTAQFQGIRFGSTAGGAACTVIGNTVANIAYTTTSSAAGVWSLVGFGLNGSANIIFGSAGNGNTFGSMTTTGSITLTNNGASGSIGIVGIYHNMSGTCSIAYNNFGGITLQGTRAGAESEMIYFGPNTGAVTVDNNIFGGTVANSINIISDSPLYGINNEGNTSGVIFSNNTIQNVSHNAATALFGGISNISGPLTATGNTIKNITGTSNANYNIIYHVPSAAATADISSNTIQDITLTNTGINAIVYGIRITSGNSVTCNANTIGGAIANNITVAGNGKSNGIFKSGTGNLTCNSNSIQQFSLTSTGATAIFRGIEITGGTLSATSNTITDISIAANAATLLVNIGILSVSASVNHFISQNTVQNLNATTTAAVSMGVAGIYVQGGTGSITKNFISGLTNQSTPGNSDITGIQMVSGTWNAYNNVVQLDNAPYTNDLVVYGLEENEATATTTCYHNTVKIGGTISAGSVASYAFYRGGAGTDNVKNNIFQNLRMGGTGGHYAEYAVGGGTYNTNNNYLEVASDQSRLGNYAGSNYNFTNWKTVTSAAQDQNGIIALDAIGKVSTVPFVGAGTGTNLTATVADDKLSVTRGIAPWMGAFEGQNITTSAISPLTYCAGAAVSVPYTVGGSGTFNGGNIFIAQLSDAAGDFTAPTNIGTLASTTSGTIAATIPGPTPAGAGYLIRVISSDPFVTGSDNGANISIAGGIPAAPVADPATGIGCSGFTANWTASVGAVNYFLDVATDAAFTAMVPGYNNLNAGAVTSYIVTGLNAATNYYYRLRAENGCGTSANSGVIGPVLTSGTPATYAVDVLTDTDNGFPYTPGDGTNTLRKCIRLANANCGHDIIQFNLGVGGPFTINLTGALPPLTDNAGVTINGWENNVNDGIPNTIPVFNATAGSPMNANYKIILGNGGTVTTGLILNSDYNIIQGLVLPDFGDGTVSANDIAITISGSNNQVLGCYIGMDATGTAKGTKTNIGIHIAGANNLIGDGTAAGANLVSGINGFGQGILMTGAAATGNRIRGNMIGMQKDGSTLVAGATQRWGISINSVSTNSATDNTIGGTIAGEGNVISGANNGAGDSYGIYIYPYPGSETGNKILGNIIGPRADGSTYVTGNTQKIGILIDGSNHNIVGGTTAAERNIISANETHGVIFYAAGATDNVVKGNYIGIDKTGTAFITGNTQDYGIRFDVVSGGNNTIGGSGAGEGNVISGNSDGSNAGRGVYINSSAAAGNLILGNIIGPQADGVSFLASNAQNIGITIISSLNNTIGGNIAGARNIISANGDVGVYITGATSTGNVVKGNYIGIDNTGTTFITGSTQDYGVYIESSATSNIIGGSGTGEGNVISGNNDGVSTGKGIYLVSAAAGGNTVMGNIIGPQADGLTYLAFNAQFRGIEINGSPNNIIGGNTAGARNIISANEAVGLQISGAASTGNIIKGNYIGIDKNGTGIITGSTQDYGIDVSTTASPAEIGGSNAGEGNVISGNSLYGIGLGNTAGSNTVRGNIIGPQANGLSWLPSNIQGTGVFINSSPNNTIGGTTAGERNTVSANETTGIIISGASATGNLVKGNYIGLAQNGTSFIAGSTQDYGVYITSSSANNTIGGSAANEGNVISGNGKGVYINSTSATGNFIKGNIIGLQMDGINYLGSNIQTYGIEFSGAKNSVIGGTTVNERNILSGNENLGVFLNGAGCSGNVVKGNYIGTDITGTSAIAGALQDYGIYLGTTSTNNTIGGINAGEGNVISGSKGASAALGYGVMMTSVVGGDQVIGNIIGLQQDGSTYLAGNGQSTGVYVSSSLNNIIGGSTVAHRNIISGNETRGVYITGAGSTGNTIKGNYIGPGSSLANIAGSNQDYGVNIIASAANNTIGSTAAGEDNKIAFNTVQGINLFNTPTTGNKISGNPVYSNTGKPINLNYGANQGNSGKAVPVITSVTGTTVSGTAANGDVIEVFKNTTSNCFDASNFVGSATTAAGVWSLSGLSLANGDYVLATATDAGNNTSEFSGCVPFLSNTIFTEAIAPALLCRGGSITITYTITGTYNAGNIFTAQLSDEFGSFATPTVIGSVATTSAAPITATIPIGTNPGTLYRIHVVSSDPVVTGSDNGANLTVPPDGGAGPWVWTGAVGTSWFDPCNWDKKCLPDSFSDVTIPVTANNPHINGATATCKTITVNAAAGAKLNIHSTTLGKITITP